jgi:hypothetical protein
MTTKISMNAIICGIALAFGLTNPMVAYAVCFDECVTSPPPNTVVRRGAAVVRRPAVVVRRPAVVVRRPQRID